MLISESDINILLNNILEESCMELESSRDKIKENIKKIIHAVCLQGIITVEDKTNAYYYSVTEVF
jgi:hypothetical protein